MSEDKGAAARDRDHERITEAAQVIRESRTGLVLTGRIKDGKLELDKPTLDEIQQRYPDSDVSFIALNSPFDANSIAV